MRIAIAVVGLTVKFGPSVRRWICIHRQHHTYNGFRNDKAIDRHVGRKVCFVYWTEYENVLFSCSNG